MSEVLTARDPGPMARLADVQADGGAAQEVFHRLTEGLTLREIAKSWGVPRGAFTRWFMERHADLFDAAAKVRADELAQEALAISDEQEEVVKKDGTTFDPDVPRDKLRVDTRLRLAEKWDRARYGSKDSGPVGGITVIVDRSCGGTVEISAGGATARIPLAGSTEASAIPAEKSLEKLEI